ncbi:MAG: SDR family NAD(P)-dependent oxidoreductase [Hydrogenophaga sp.]|uniref:SDR family NAD(P)-dependent oxidoreductase n=1 Tax=Hydrogenophaga sp. TaxID=1904254 RepID=UPI003D109D03
MRLANKKAIVTAAASGMGQAGCEAFAREGATVVAIDIDAQRLKTVVDQINASGGKAHGIVADLLDANACRSTIEEAARLMGGIDVLWAHAGMPGLREVENLDMVAYDEAMNLNVRAGLLAAGAALPFMRKAGGGSILFTASTAGLVGASVSPVYSTAKFAVVGMTKSLALRCAADRIRVNVICPGPIDTPMFPKFFDPNASAEMAAKSQAAVLAAIPLGRIGQPHEVANAALWLASDEASFVTGAALPVDGGFTAR